MIEMDLFGVSRVCLCVVMFGSFSWSYQSIHGLNTTVGFWRRSALTKDKDGQAILTTAYKLPQQYSHYVSNYWTRESLRWDLDGSLILTTTYKLGHGLHVKDCSELHQRNPSLPSNVYRIYPAGGRGVLAYCDMTTDGGGWTVIQRRIDGSLNFYMPWNKYKIGFGNPYGEYWIGNDALHKLTLSRKRTMYIKLLGKSSGGKWVYAKYTDVFVNSESNKYRLTFREGSYTGTAGNYLHKNGYGDHYKMKFSTYDNDNDLSSGNCAKGHKGGWWFNSCEFGCLNCEYLAKDSTWGPLHYISTWIMIK